MGGIVVVLVLIVLSLQVVLLWGGRQGPVASVPAGELLSTEDHKQLAIRLEDKNLPQAAAEAWTAYLSEAKPPAGEAARVMVRIGKLRQDSGDFQSAIREYYQAERLLESGPKDEELSRTITLRVRECFRKLGQYGELARELAERSSAAGEGAPLAGQQVVAQIGDEKITVADFDRLISEQIESAIKSQPDLTPEEAEAFRQRTHERLADPQAKSRQLQQIVLTRVLADEARRQGVHESPAFRERIATMADSMLADTLMTGEIGKRAVVTPRDVERYFEADKDRYAEPATTTLAHVVCATRKEAAEVIAQAKGGEDFAALAKNHSSDEQTKEKGGVVPDPLTEGAQSVPGIGGDAELVKRIAETAPGGFLAEPFQSEKGWEAIKVVSRTERVAKKLDEVRDQAERDTRMARRQEVSQQYVQELMQAAGAKLFPEAFTMQPSPKKDEPK